MFVRLLEGVERGGEILLLACKCPDGIERIGERFEPIEALGGSFDKLLLDAASLEERILSGIEFAE